MVRVRPRRLTKLQGLIILLVLIAVAGGVVHFPRGVAAYQEWRLSRLPLKQLEAAAKEHPQDVRVLYHLGTAYARANRLDDAARTLVKVVNLQPTHAKAFNDLGVTYMAQGKQSEALLALKAAVEAQPAFAKAHANLGRLYLMVRSPYSATSSLTRAVELDPKDALAWVDLGVAHQETYNFKKSLEAFLRAAALAPQNPDVWSGMGETYRSLARPADAEQAFRRALQLNPQHAGALLGLGRLALEQAKSREDFRRAAKLFRQSLASDPQNVTALYNLGCTQRKLGDERGAVRSLERAFRLAPTETSVMYQLGQAYVAAGRKAEGQRLLKQFERLAALLRERDVLEKRLDDERENVPAHVRLAELYLLFNEPSKAARVCRLALAQQPDHAHAHRLLATALRMLGQRAEAEHHDQRAMELERSAGSPAAQK
ncbi:MAG: tetratricopeptide repeat protein [Abditibacteriales bacterium]|nr:tetratricopeptide repeat protein [Abditibacteriales bacterium]MDW8368016.1 tetratricopeptide repeat protein [Abditibacteriales bacterium]